MSQTLTARVHAGYRLTLKSLRGEHAAQRRQRARQITADRYKVPVSMVKHIVREQDAVQGITHEHSPSYLRALEVRQVQLDWEANPTPCECGNWILVRARVNPGRCAGDGRAQITTQCFLCILAEDG